MNQVVFDQLEQIRSLFDQNDFRRAFLVADRDAYAMSGAEDRLKSVLAGFPIALFRDFQPNPELSVAVSATRQFLSSTQDCLVGLGGGTAIDLAKLVSICAAQPVQPASIEHLTSSNLVGRSVPLIAVPTTSGTGSEATPFAVVYAKEKKYSISHASLRPDVAILDPTLTFSLPAAVTAASGLDAVCQSIESMWSVQSTAQSIAIAEQALERGARHLVPAVCNPSPEDRAAMMQAAHLAGQAIHTSKTTGPHALSYHMTIKHGVPHGVAVAISLAAFLELTANAQAEDVVDPRGLDHLHGVLRRIYRCVSPPVDTSTDFATQWRSMLRSMGCPTRLGDCGIETVQERTALVSAVNQQRLANHPVRVSRAALERIVETIA